MIFSNVVGIDGGINFIAATYDSKRKSTFVNGRAVKQKRAHCFKKAVDHSCYHLKFTHLSLERCSHVIFCIGAPHLLQNFEPGAFLAPHEGQDKLSGFLGMTGEDMCNSFPSLEKDMLLNVLYAPSIHKAKPTTMVVMTCDSCGARGNL